MKIICNQEEAKILMINCSMEYCDCCFLSPVCNRKKDSGSVCDIIILEDVEERQEL